MVLRYIVCRMWLVHTKIYNNDLNYVVVHGQASCDLCDNRPYKLVLCRYYHVHGLGFLLRIPLDKGIERKHTIWYPEGHSIQHIHKNIQGYNVAWWKNLVVHVQILSEYQTIRVPWCLVKVTYRWKCSQLYEHCMFKYNIWLWKKFNGKLV